MTENTTTEPVTVRPRLDRLLGADIAGRRALELAGVGVDELTHVDLYSCFPAAVQIYATELGLSSDRPLTVTGGMTFGGGPFNNYVLQSTAELARVLRGQPGTYGLVTLVSGFVSKQAFDIWSTEPPEGGLAMADVTDEVKTALRSRELDPGYTGPATIVSSTVGFTRGEPWEALAVVDTPSGRRALARTQDHAVLTALQEGEWIGHEVAVVADGSFRPG
jgi:acetyl-CoA C-acetyltransferase